MAAVVGGNQNGTTTINGQGTPGTPSVGLIDSTGAASGITLSLSFSAAVDTGAAGGGADYAGPYPAKVSAWPAAAVSDGFFSQINNGGSTMNMSFTGLDDNLAYDLMFYGARGTGTGLNQATYTVTGRDGASSRTTSVLNNSAQTPEFLGPTFAPGPRPGGSQPRRQTDDEPSHDRFPSKPRASGHDSGRSSPLRYPSRSSRDRSASIRRTSRRRPFSRGILIES